jgi:signal transduction histidine kinase
MKLGSKLSLVGVSLVVLMTVLLMITVNYSIGQHERERVNRALLDSSNKFQQVLANKEQALTVQVKTFFQDPLRLAEIENYQQPMSFHSIIQPYLEDIGYHSTDRFAAVFHEVVDDNDKLSLNLLYPPNIKDQQTNQTDTPAWYQTIRQLLTQKTIQSRLNLDESLIEATLRYGQTYLLDGQLYRVQKVPIQNSQIDPDEETPPVGVFVLFEKITSQFAHQFILEDEQTMATKSAQQRQFDIAFINNKNKKIFASTRPSMDQTLQWPEVMTGDETMEKAIFEIDINQQHYLAVWRLWSQTEDRSGYILLKNYDVALAPLRELRNNLLLVSGVVLILAIMTMLLFTRSVVKPISRLLQGTKTVRDGNMSLRLPINSEDEIGELTQAFNQMVDEVRQKEQMETLLAQKEIERHRSISEMVAGVAHEVNTPLGIVNSAASIIEASLNADIRAELLQGKNADETEELAEILEDVVDSSELIQSNIKRTSDLIQRFKSLSVSQMSDELETMLMIDKVEELIMLYKISAQDSPLEINFSHQLSDKTSIWQGYAGYLFQIIQNLLSNVDRYAYPEGGGGKVDISLQASNLKGSKAFCLRVQDFGIGMDEKTLARIFDAFYTTGRNKGGSGLGMAITHNLVTSALQGTIDVTSTLQQGTTTTFCFPQTIKKTTGSTTPELKTQGLES